VVAVQVAIATLAVVMMTAEVPEDKPAGAMRKCRPCFFNYGQSHPQYSRRVSFPILAYGLRAIDQLGRIIPDLAVLDDYVSEKLSLSLSIVSTLIAINAGTGLLTSIIAELLQTGWVENRSWFLAWR